MTYKSKVDICLVVLCFGITLIAIFPLLLIDFKVWDLCIFFFVFVFLGDVFLNTKYVVNGQILEVRCGHLSRARYDIQEIKQIEESHSWESAPALSLSRIRIIFIDGKSILISPKEKADFLKLLYSVNSKIKI